MDRAPESDGEKSHAVRIAVISAIQAVVVALITAGTQYYVSVKPRDRTIDRLENRFNLEAPSQKALLPKGSGLVFHIRIMNSRSLSVKEGWKTDEAWDNKCKALASKGLVAIKFDLVNSRSDLAVRGERQTMHLGILCDSKRKAAVVYGVAHESDIEMFKYVTAEFVNFMIKQWDDLI